MDTTENARVLILLIVYSSVVREFCLKGGFELPSIMEKIALFFFFCYSIFQIIALKMKGEVWQETVNQELYFKRKG